MCRFVRSLGCVETRIACLPKQLLLGSANRCVQALLSGKAVSYFLQLCAELLIEQAFRAWRTIGSPLVFLSAYVGKFGLLSHCLNR